MSKPHGSRIAVAVVVVAGVVATAASNQAPSGDVTGSSDNISITLDSGNVSEERNADATLSTSLPVSSGDLTVSASFSGDAVAQVRMGLASSTDSREVDVLDTTAQPSVQLGVDAWNGCNSDCTESLTITFDRLEADVVDPVTIDFVVDGSVTLAGGEGEGDPGPAGSITIDVN